MKKQNLSKIEPGRIYRTRPGNFQAQLVQLDSSLVLKISKSSSKNGIYIRSKDELKLLDELIELINFIKLSEVPLPDGNANTGNGVVVIS